MHPATKHKKNHTRTKQKFHVMTGGPSVQTKTEPYTHTHTHTHIFAQKPLS